MRVEPDVVARRLLSLSESLSPAPHVRNSIPCLPAIARKSTAGAPPGFPESTIAAHTSRMNASNTPAGELTITSRPISGPSDLNECAMPRGTASVSPTWKS